MKKKISIRTIPILILGLLLLNADHNSESINNNGKPETGSFTDPRDGKIYKIVKIGDQWVLAENFAYKPGTGKYWAYDNEKSNIEIYGYLYDWETAMNITPDGWHLPSRKEWFALLKTLGAKRTTFPYLEKVYPKSVVDGISGLDMPFGGFRTCNGKFTSLGDKARFWNSNESGSDYATFGLNSNKDRIPHGLNISRAPFVYNNGYQKSCPGYGVRLFKD